MAQVEMREQSVPVARAAMDDRSVGELFSELAGEMSSLVRQEIKLAKVEVGAKVASLQTNLITIAAAALVAYAGVIILLIGVVFLLGLAIPIWASALLVGVVVAGGAAAFGYTAFERLRNTDVTPTDTIDSIKEDAKWLKDQM